MELDSLVTIFRVFEKDKVRYLVVGGLAVVAHGYLRLTADLDLMLDLEENNLRRVVEGLSSLGYRPRAPVKFEEFIDPGIRDRWIREKDLTVFSLFSPNHKETEVDLFVQNPIEFESVHIRAVRKELAPGLEVPFIGLEDLLILKRDAGRLKDLLDVEQLTRMQEKKFDE